MLQTSEGIARFKRRFQFDPTRRFEPVVLSVLLVWVLAIAILWGPALIRPDFGMLPGESGDYRAQDFSIVLNYAKGIVFQWSDRPYHPDGMAEIATRWLGPVDVFMFNPYPPTVALLLLPLTPLPQGIGYVIWIAIGCTALAWALQTWLGVNHLGISRWFYYAAIFSPATTAALTLGQSSLLSTAALTVVFFLHRPLDCKPAGKIALRHLLISSSLLTLLSAKPPLALIAFLWLAACGWWKPFFAGWFGIAAVAVAALFWCGPEWPIDFIANAACYGDPASHVGQFFTNQVTYEAMTNLRGLLVRKMGVTDSLAVTFSWTIWLVASLGLLITKWCRPTQVTAESAFAWSCLIFLCAFPHVNGYEDILLIAVVAALASDSRPIRPARILFGICAAALIVIYSGLPRFFTASSMGWLDLACLAKVSLLCLLILHCTSELLTKPPESSSTCS